MDVEKIIKGSVSYRTDKLPPYLCSVYTYITEEIIPRALIIFREEFLYFVYGGRADAVYNKESHPLTSDWDIIIFDREAGDIIPKFAEQLRDYIHKLVNIKFSYVNGINIITDNKNYNQKQGEGRYTVSLVDPYIPYEKTYDLIDISGCHETRNENYINYCDVFETRRNIEGIYYASPEFILSETQKVLASERLSKLKNDKKDLIEAIKDKKLIETKLEEGEELSLEDVDILENLEDIIDKYLSSFIKFSRTQKRMH